MSVWRCCLGCHGCGRADGHRAGRPRRARILVRLAPAGCERPHVRGALGSQASPSRRDAPGIPGADHGAGEAAPIVAGSEATKQSQSRAPAVARRALLRQAQALLAMTRSVVGRCAERGTPFLRLCEERSDRTLTFSRSPNRTRVSAHPTAALLPAGGRESTGRAPRQSRALAPLPQAAARPARQGIGIAKHTG